MATARTFDGDNFYKDAAMTTKFGYNANYTMDFPLITQAIPYKIDFSYYRSCKKEFFSILHNSALFQLKLYPTVIFN